MENNVKVQNTVATEKKDYFVVDIAHILCNNTLHVVLCHGTASDDGHIQLSVFHCHDDLSFRIFGFYHVICRKGKTKTFAVIFNLFDCY